MILVKSRINDTERNFVFDTGAKTLVLNNKYVDNKTGSTGKEYKIRGIHSRVANVSDRKVKKFQMGQIIKTDFIALVMEFSVMEEVVGYPVYGLIGYDFFSGYDIFIDYDNNILTFIPEEKFMVFWNNNIANQSFSYIDMTMNQHIPVVQAKAGDKKIRLGIDTGAARTLLDKNATDVIHYEFQDFGSRDLVGVENKSEKTTSGKIRQISIGAKKYNNIEVLIKDLSHLNDNINEHIDGLIGYDILGQQKTLISYKNKKFVFID
ncbi:MAG: aspartyl protease family protein [Fidelibacterota bacterium]